MGDLVTRAGTRRGPWPGLALLGCAALATAGCNLVKMGEDASPAAASSPPPAPIQARLSVMILPNPVIVLRDTRKPSSRTARWTVYIFENGGVGGTVAFVNATVREADTGAPVEPQGFLSMDRTEIRRRAGTDRLPPGASLAIPQSLAYDSVGAAATLAVAVQVMDDNGNLVGQAATARLE
jgi:hypothetical protein